MHRHDDRHRVAMHSLEGRVVARIDGHDSLGVGVQFLDIDAGTESAAIGTNHDDPHLRVLPQGFEGTCQVQPFLAIEGIDRWPVDHQLSDPRLETGVKGGMGCGGGCTVHRCSSIGERHAGSMGMHRGPIIVR